MSTESDIERKLLRSDSELPSGSDWAMSGLASLEHESQLTNVKFLDAKLKQKFTSFKKSFGEKEKQHGIEFKKLKSEAKTSGTFKYKDNRFQYEFGTWIFSMSSHVLFSFLVEIFQKLIPNLSVSKRYCTY